MDRSKGLLRRKGLLLAQPSTSWVMPRKTFIETLALDVVLTGVAVLGEVAHRRGDGEEVELPDVRELGRTILDQSTAPLIKDLAYEQTKVVLARIAERRLGDSDPYIAKRLAADLSMATREAYEESLEQRTAMRAAPPASATFGERLAARVDASREFALDLGVAPTALATAAHAIVDVAELVVTQLWYRWQRRRIEAATSASASGDAAAGALIRKGGKEGELVALDSRIKPLGECAKSAAYALLRAAAGGGCEIIAGSTGVLILPGLGSYLTLLRELLLPHIGLPALRV